MLEIKEKLDFPSFCSIPETAEGAGGLVGLLMKENCEASVAPCSCCSLEAAAALWLIVMPPNNDMMCLACCLNYFLIILFYVFGAVSTDEKDRFYLLFIVYSAQLEKMKMDIFM